MARKKAIPGPKPVNAITHGDKRANIPTADAHAFVDPDIEAVRKVRYARDETLDPQIVWRGKYPPADELDTTDSGLIVDAPPIYIQEKVDPRVLIENLRRTAARPEDEPELALFDSFDGLGELDLVDFYQHDANWSNRMILGDSLQVMASLAERERLRGKVQMIYVDPPYGIKFGSNWQVSARKRDVKDGKIEDVAREAEQIKAFRDTWELGIHSYLSYLRDRLLAARELLTESGSCFVQIGDENVHLVRSLLDEVFGSQNFVSQISFRTTSGAGSFAGGTNVLASTNDYVLWYSRNLEVIKYRQLFLRKGLGGAGGGQYTWIELPDGSRRRATSAELSGERARVLRPDQFTSQTTRVGQTTVFPIEVDGKTYTPSKGGWKTNRDGAAKLVNARRLLGIGNTLTYVRYLDDFPAFPINNFWGDTVTSGFSDPKTYVVQTNTKVIERCMLMCTDPGDLVLDPTCGSGTSAFVAEQWGRRWITIDTSRVALALARQRITTAKYPWYLLADTPDGHDKEQSLTTTLLPRQEFGGDIRHGFVYERVQHITLKSIANNPDIRKGMSREEIDAAIKRQAEFELLYDKPYEDPKKVRVSGPFTVESLSPHRSIAFAGGPEPTVYESAAEAAAVKDAAAPNFEQSILDNLAKAGIQNGQRKERIEFAAFETYAGKYIQAIGERAGEKTATRRAGWRSRSARSTAL
ncbi:site-specific DNA-methyltransferase [Pseudonocardia benzenivorans]